VHRHEHPRPGRRRARPSAAGVVRRPARVDPQHPPRVLGYTVYRAVGVTDDAAVPLAPTHEVGTHETHLLGNRVDAQYLAGRLGYGVYAPVVGRDGSAVVLPGRVPLSVGETRRNNSLPFLLLLLRVIETIVVVRGVGVSVGDSPSDDRLVVEILLVGYAQGTDLVRPGVYPEHLVRVARQTVHDVPRYDPAQPLELPPQYAVGRVVLRTDGIHVVRDGVDAQDAGGVAGYAVYLLVRALLPPEVQGGAPQGPGVRPESPSDGLLSFPPSAVVAIVVAGRGTGGGVEVVQVRTARGPVGDAARRERMRHGCHD